MPPDADQLLDTLAGILRDYGDHAFDLERVDARKVRGLFDQWAQHVLTGVPAPGQPVGVTGPRRNHAALRASFATHRKQEALEFDQAREALREVVWVFIASLNKEISAERAEDAKLSSALSQVGSSLQTAAPTDLRRLALEAVKQVHDVFSARRERQRRQVAELGEKLEAVGSQLEVARRESTIDALTELYNRRAFDDQLTRVHELAALREGGAALFVFDIDHFKKVNDGFGHPAGDAVLKAVAHALVRVFKRKGDFVARYGGEELVAMARDLSAKEAAELAERAREAVAALKTVHDKREIKVTVSVGVANWQRSEDAATWLSRADVALFQAKQWGRDQVRVSD
jgi:diguanylate cyclase